MRGERHVSFARVLSRARSSATCKAKFGYKSIDGSAAHHQGHPEHGRVSEAVADKKVIEHAVSDLTKIAGQKPVITKTTARPSPASRSAKTIRSVAW